jgi:hypothetical protein
MHAASVDGVTNIHSSLPEELHLKSHCAFRLLLLILCVTTLALAQSTDATISGVVVDPSGKAITDADIELLNDATGVHYTNKTNGAGIYTVSILPPGQYRVQVSKVGFKTLIKPGIVLNVQDALALNFTLPLGATSESITIEAGASMINTTDASVGTVVDRKFVENIPLNGRSFQDLVSMTPGVVTQSPQSESTVGNNGDFSVNGQRTESNYYTVDGVSGNISGGTGSGYSQSATGGTIAGSTALGTTQSLVSVDALQEFRVESSTYSAEYGHSPGGQFSLATRSGTNEVHGSAFNYLRNNFFDANDWFNDHYRTPQPALRQNDFGGTLGGPVWFPTLYSGKNQTFFFTSYEGLRLSQPTAATIQYVPDTYLRQQAVPAMQGILNAFPHQNGIDYGTAASPNLAQFIAAYSAPSNIDSTSVRVDHTYSPKLSLFFRYGDTPSSSSSRPYVFVLQQSSNIRTYTLGTTSQLSSRLTNAFRLGYDRADSSRDSHLDTFGAAIPINLAQALGSGSFARPSSAIYISAAGVGYSEMEGAPLLQNLSRQWNLVDTFSVTFGHHQLRAGVDYRHIKTPLKPYDVGATAEFFSAGSILSGVPDDSYAYNYVAATPLFNQTALFVQDEWRAGSRLSLSLGLRWEVAPPPVEQHGDDAFTLLGNISDPASLILAPRGTPLYNTTWFNFAPRIGMAWTAYDRQGAETIIRAGGGVFFDSPDQIAADGYSGFGFTTFRNISGALLPYTTSELTVPFSTTPPYTSASIYAFPPRLQLPYTLQWNTSIQQALGNAQAFTLSYVGANGRRLISQELLALSHLSPTLGNVYELIGLTSNYQAAQVQFQRSVAHGVHVLAAYTWSHSLDFGSSSSSTETPLERGNSDFDLRNNLQAGLSCDLPSLRANRLAGLIANGWGLDGRLNLRSAFPIMVYGNNVTDPTSGNTYYTGVNYDRTRPIYLRGSQYPGGRALNGGINNPATPAFTLPLGTDVGNAPRNFVRGFDADQLNLAARRQFPLHDAVSLQFRAEAFNILNHPNFGYVYPYLAYAQFGHATKMLNSSLGTMASQYQQGGARSLQFALKLAF